MELSLGYPAENGEAGDRAACLELPQADTAPASVRDAGQLRQNAARPDAGAVFRMPDDGAAGACLESAAAHTRQ